MLDLQHRPQHHVPQNLSDKRRMSPPNIIKPSISHPPWYIYESQLSDVVEGVPLWIPGPYKEVDGSWNPIGLTDVGYKTKGRFVKLFNAATSAANGCSPFPQEKLRNPIFSPRTEDRFVTSSVEAHVANMVTEKDSGNVQMSVNLSNRCNEGAAMILLGPDGAAKMESFDLRHPRFYADYCFRHCESWLQAAHAADEDVQIKDLIFVTGFDMANAWALFAFPSPSDVCSVEFTASETTMSATRQDSKPSTSLNCPPMMSFGPIDRRVPGSLDQCVVIRRFKIHRRVDRLKWQMNKSLQKVLSKHNEVPDAISIVDDLAGNEGVITEDDGEPSENDKKRQIRKRRRSKPSPGSYFEESGLHDHRRGGGGGPGSPGSGSSSTDASSRCGPPPGNGGRRGTGSGSSSSDSGSGHRGHVSRYTLNDDGTASLADGDFDTTPHTSDSDDFFESDSSDEPTDSDRVEPLDALLEYLLETCPSATYAGAGDYDLLRFQSLLRDWDSFPAWLRTIKPEVHRQSNGLVLLKDSVYYMTPLHDAQGEMDKFTASFVSQRQGEASKSAEETKAASPMQMIIPFFEDEMANLKDDVDWFRNDMCTEDWNGKTAPFHIAADHMLSLFENEHFLEVPDARLTSQRAVHGKEPGKRSLFFSFLSPLLFCAPDVHLRGLEKIYVDGTACQIYWTCFLQTLASEWVEFILYGTILLNANVAFLSIPGVYEAAQVASLLSAASSMGAIMAGLLLVRQHRDRAKDTVTFPKVDNLSSGAHPKLRLEKLAIMYSLPYALLIWAMVTFLAEITLASFHKCDVPPFTILGVTLLFIGSVILWATYVGWEYRLSRLHRFMHYRVRYLKRLLGVYWSDIYLDKYQPFTLSYPSSSPSHLRT